MRIETHSAVGFFAAAAVLIVDHFLL